MSYQNLPILSLNPNGTTTEPEQAVELIPQGNELTNNQDPAVAIPRSPQPEVSTGVYVTVHGHFYQPPRENPYLDAVERQPSAAPFHDWNERIHYECYRPNAFARIFNDQGEVVEIVNNYEYLSFNMGATLLSWLERYDLETYQKIIEADGLSQKRLGHGNAIAQVYNHIIMPLANERDKYTQIRWGKEDFRSRFGREPEGMWLAETAVDYLTLEALVAEGIKFIILAPSQAERCRPLPSPENHNPAWQEVGGSQIDPTRPYRCYLSSDRSAFLDIFFYDGPISRDMGFSDVLTNSYFLTGRIGQAVRGDHRPHQLIAVATDGETFGHHKGGAEKCLAYAFAHEFASRGWQVTNFAHYLSLYAPEWEVELKSVTAWSCAHGVDRWQDDCGCGGGGTWHQKWRKPLRSSLNWLRDELTKVYETEGSRLFGDPWQARDEYIRVIIDRSPSNVSHFLAIHSHHPLSPPEQIDALRLLEMQRHALLMFTSCGWFFEEISRPEGVQILRYAARAIELAGDVAGVQLEREFVQQLQAAPSNVDHFHDGAKIYAELVTTAVVNFSQVAAQYAISSLFPNQTGAPDPKQVYCYKVEQQDWQLQRLGVLTLAVGQLHLTSEITLESSHLVYAVLHLGGWDFHCCLQPFEGRLTYNQMKEDLFATLQGGSAGIVIVEMNQLFANSKSFGLQDLLAEERHRIMGLLTTETISRLDQLYTQAYRDNYGVLMAFHRDELPPPPELQVAAEVALSYRVINAVQSLTTEESVHPWLGELEAIAKEARLLHCHLNISGIKPTLEEIVWRNLWELLHNHQPQTLGIAAQNLQRILLVSQNLGLVLGLERSQELYFQWQQSLIIPPVPELRAIGKLLAMRT